MRLATFLTTLIACALLLALPAASAAGNATDERIVEDCSNSPTGALRGSYSLKQLNHALNHLPGDIREYTGCSDAIRQAMRGGGGHGGGGAGGDGMTGGPGGGFGSSGGQGGGATGGSPADAQPPAGAERPIDVAGATIAPGALPEIGKDSHRLPTALLVLLVLLGLAAVVPTALTIGRRVVGHRRP